MSEAVRLLEEFVTLSVQARRDGLDVTGRKRMQALEESLRDTIDGARPAPKRIANPTAVEGAGPPPARRPASITEDLAATPHVPLTDDLPRASTQDLVTGLSQPAGIGAPPNQATADLGVVTQDLKAKGVPPAKPKGISIGAIGDALHLATTDQNKLRSVQTDDLTLPSSYTPPQDVPFLEDYFEIGLSASQDLGIVPVGAVVAGGGTPELRRDAKELLGLAAPRPARPAERRPGSRASSKSPPRAASQPQGIPLIVHLLKGGSVRGHAQAFAPESGSFVLNKPKESGTETVDLESVLAIFIGVKRGTTPTAAAAQKTIVTLVNDKKIAGTTPDYVEGGAALTIVPEPRRGNVDRIWIPAVAVKAIEFID